MWTKSNGDRPHVVQKFFYSFGDGSSLNESLTISKIAESFTKKEKALLFTEDGLREMVKDLGTFVSARKVKIDGMDCGEVTVRIKRESPAVTIYMYLIQYYLIYKDKMINISFGTGGMEESQVKNLFNKYKLLFQTFATNTVLITKWE